MTTVYNATSTKELMPTRPSATTYIFTNKQLKDYRVVVSASSSLATKVGLADLPILLMGRVAPIQSINIYIKTSASASNGDQWDLHVNPMWYSIADPTDPAGSVFAWMREDVVDTATRIVQRTQPSNEDSVITLLHASVSGATATIISGGGSEISATEPQKIALVAPAISIDLVADTNDDIDISELIIYGSYEAT